MSTVLSGPPSPPSPSSPSPSPRGQPAAGGFWRRWLPWALVVTGAVVALVVGLDVHSAKPSLDAQVTHIASELKCPVCDGETVAESEAAPSVQMRSEIRQDLANGEPAAQIISGFEASYGPGILERPPAQGVGLLVWLLPVLGVAVGGGGVGLVVWRWRRSADGGGAGESGASGAGDTATDVDGGSDRVEPVGSDGVGSDGVGSVGSVGSDGVGPVDGGVGPTRPRGRRRRSKVILSCLGALLMVAGTGWVLASATGHRLPGEEITGAALGADQVDADLLAAQSDEQKNPPDVTGAVKEFQNVLNSVPNQVEALTGEGWLLAQTDEPSLVQKGLSMLSRAETVEPDYAPAHLYRGLALLGEGDFSDCIPELEWYLGHGPAPSVTVAVRKALAEAQTAEKGATSAGAQPAG